MAIVAPKIDSDQADLNILLSRPDTLSLGSPLSDIFSAEYIETLYKYGIPDLARLLETDSADPKQLKCQDYQPKRSQIDPIQLPIPIDTESMEVVAIDQTIADLSIEAQVELIREASRVVSKYCYVLGRNIPLRIAGRRSTVPNPLRTWVIANHYLSIFETVELKPIGHWYTKEEGEEQLFNFVTIKIPSQLFPD